MLKDWVFDTMIYLEKKQTFGTSKPLFININSINYQEREIYGAVSELYFKVKGIPLAIACKVYKTEELHTFIFSTLFLSVF